MRSKWEHQLQVCTGSREVGRFGLLRLSWSLSFQPLLKGVSTESRKACINSRESKIFWHCDSWLIWLMALEFCIWEKTALCEYILQININTYKIPLEIRGRLYFWIWNILNYSSLLIELLKVSSKKFLHLLSSFCFFQHTPWDPYQACFSSHASECCSKKREKLEKIVMQVKKMFL